MGLELEKQSLLDQIICVVNMITTSSGVPEGEIEPTSQKGKTNEQ